MNLSSKAWCDHNNISLNCCVSSSIIEQFRTNLCNENNCEGVEWDWSSYKKAKHGVWENKEHEAEIRKWSWGRDKEGIKAEWQSNKIDQRWRTIYSGDCQFKPVFIITTSSSSSLPQHGL